MRPGHDRARPTRSPRSVVAPPFPQSCYASGVDATGYSLSGDPPHSRPVLDPGAEGPREAAWESRYRAWVVAWRDGITPLNLRPPVLPLGRHQ